MIKAIYTLMIIFSAVALSAQPKIKVNTVEYAEKDGESLKVDIYNPKSKDSNRICVLYMHGGGFSGGNRDHVNHNNFCKYFAEQGYLTATMSYRYTMKGKGGMGANCPAEDKLEAFIKSSDDLKSCVAYLVRNSDKYGIDPDKIVVIGSSAGAEAVINAVYWPMSKTLDKEQALDNDFKFGGVVSMAGAMTDTLDISESNVIPTLLFHGTCDNLVPYGTAPHHYNKPTDPGYLMLHGAYSIAQRLKNLGHGYHLVTGCNGWHEWNSDPLQYNREEILTWLKKDVEGGEERQIHTIYQTDKKECNHGVWNFCK